MDFFFKKKTIPLVEYRKKIDEGISIIYIHTNFLTISYSKTLIQKFKNYSI